MPKIVIQEVHCRLKRGIFILAHLHIKNIALIEELSIDFHFGLNILSGETGAGKSIMIDSINFVLGERFSKDIIRNGEDSAMVEAMMTIEQNSTREELKNLGIELDEDNALLIARSIQANSKSVCRINGRVVTIGMLKTVSRFLIDIHGQHQHQSLLDASKHINLLDSFCTEDLEKLKAELANYLRTYKEIKKKILTISGDERERVHRIDLLKFQTEEISLAELSEDEEADLLKRKKILNNSERLSRNTGSILRLLYGDESSEAGAIDKISQALDLANAMQDIDTSQTMVADNLESALLQLDDIARQVRSYSENIEHNPQEINAVESRLDLIYNLKRKYGSSISEILEFCKKQEEALHLMLNSEEELEKLNAESTKLEKELNSICEKISLIRKKQAEYIQASIISNLHELGMKDAEFSIKLDKKEEVTHMGYDKVEFMISANKGEPIKPLSKIASGGEMSRVMLALKTVLADSDSIETFIFDEIDSGVSGRTAQKVAEKLNLIGKKQQILCITHLPQIASMADYHYLIEKKAEGSKTISIITELDQQKTIQEIARLIGGAKITDATLTAAKEMKQLTLVYK